MCSLLGNNTDRQVREPVCGCTEFLSDWIFLSLVGEVLFLEVYISKGSKEGLEQLWKFLKNQSEINLRIRKLSMI